MIAVGAAMLVFAASSAYGEVRIVKANGQPVPEGAASKAFNPKTGGWEVQLHQLYAPFADSVFEVRANAGETIDSVVSHVNGPAAGSPVIIRVYGESPGYLRSVGGIVQVGNAETILNRVQVLEDVGSIQVEVIGDVLAGRDVVGPIVATTGDNAIRGVTSVQVGRHILGDIVAEHGRILLVYSSGGNIGEAVKPVVIRAKHAVYQVEAKEIHAGINTRVNGGTGGLFALICDRFAGTVETERIMNNQYIPLDGLVLIRQSFSGSIVIGKSFTNPPAQYIQLPVHGLTGQIVFNADNALNGVWTAPVRLGPQGDPNQIVLTSPLYSYTPQQLGGTTSGGGGSIGLVPFRLHETACTPVMGATMTQGSGAPPLVVRMRHYGPVTVQGAAPLTIERRPKGTTQVFSPVANSEFSVQVASDDPNVLRVTAANGGLGFAAGYEYRLRPTSQLRCAVPSAPPVVWQNDFIFTVITPPCPGDINGDALVNVTDLLVVIALWNTNPVGMPAADVNGDGIVNVADLLGVISRWGSCPG